MSAIGFPIQPPLSSPISPPPVPGKEELQMAAVDPSKVPSSYASQAPERQIIAPDVSITSIAPFQPRSNYTEIQKLIPQKCDNGAIPVTNNFVMRLKEYSNTEKSLLKTMQAFVSDHLAPGTTVLIDPVRGGGTKGVSGDPVFTVRGTTGNIIAIAKGFLSKDAKNEFAQEMRAQQFLGNLGLQESTTPQGLGVGMCSVMVREEVRGKETFVEKRCFLMLQSVAPGQGVDDYLAEVGTSDDRTQAMETAKSAVKQTAKALAELHQAKANQEATPITSKQITTHLSQKLSILENHAKTLSLPGIDFKNLKRATITSPSFVRVFSEQISREFLSHPGKGSILHGDAHPGNFFYDAETNKLTMIDLPSSSPTYDGTNGLMSSAWDSQNFVFKIANNRMNGMTSKEVSELERTFKDTYREALRGSILTTPEAEKLAALDKVINSLAYYTTVINDHPSDADPERARILDMIAYRMEELDLLMHNQ
ncbi:MAG: phosphotransferase [Parachlamydia sp.]|nr:phosphotransferase [Parachlamydia sp.]